MWFVGGVMASVWQASGMEVASGAVGHIEDACAVLALYYSETYLLINYFNYFNYFRQENTSVEVLGFFLHILFKTRIHFCTYPPTWSMNYYLCNTLSLRFVYALVAPPTSQ